MLLALVCVLIFAFLFPEEKKRLGNFIRGGEGSFEEIMKTL